MKYYKGDYKYVLAEEVTHKAGIGSSGFDLPHCRINSWGFLTIDAGYAWDGASGLTFDTKSSMRGSLIHDALYQLLRETGFGRNGDGHDRNRYAADQIIRNVCIEDGMWKWRANAWFKALRAGGGSSAAVKVRKVYQAP